LGTFALLGVAKLICRHKPKVSVNELTYIWCAGLIRGAIAFGLVLRIPLTEPHRDVIVTTSLSLVLLTTIIFGSGMPLFTRCLLGK
jgi:NhaP-type Na+/H+ or K+/H+ antiporter